MSPPPYANVARARPAAPALARPRRLLYLQPAPALGGAERQASVVLPALIGHGFEPIAVTGPGRAILPWFRRSGFEDARWSPHFPDGTPLSPGQVPELLAAARALSDELDALHRETPFELVVGCLGYGWLLSSLCARRWGVPAVWRAGGLSFGRTASALSPEGVALQLLGRVLRPAALLCNAEAVARYWAPLVPAPCHVVPNGVALPPPAPPRRARGPMVLGFAGRLAPEKNLPLLFDALELLRRRGVPVRLRLAGPGPQEPIAAELRRRGLAETTELLGRVDEMSPFYRSCDAFVLPSRSEGCANVVLEAMAHGLPVVATAVGGTPELVQDGVHGSLVPGDDAPALAAALEQLATSPVMRLRLGAGARRRARAFSPERCATRIAAVLRGVLEAHAREAQGPAVAMAGASQPEPSHSPRRSSTKRFST